MFNIENKTVFLNLKKDELQNDFHSWIQVVDARDFVSPRILEWPKEIQWLLLSVFWFLFIIGTYFRFIFYEYLFQQYKNKELTEVNKLSLVICLTHHLCIVSVSLVPTLTVLNGESLDKFVLGQWYCILQLTCNRYAYAYSFIGSLGLSIYRILLIKHNYFLKDIIGKKVMANLILYGGILLAILFTMLLKSHDYDKLFDDTCMFVPKLHTLQILDNYEQSRGNLSTIEYYIKLYLGIGLVAAFMTISEIITYVIFFHHMYNHDNSDRLRRILEPSVINDRNRKNAITFFGQFCSFVLEFTGLLLLLASYTFGTRHNKLPLIFTAFYTISFAIMPMVEVLTSDVLRRKIFRIEFYNVIFGLNN